jgi:hypothetical protein
MCGDPSKMSDEERKTKYRKALTEEGRKKLSEFHKERCSKIPMPWKGKKRTDDEKKRISETLKKYFKTYKSPNIGRKMSNESREKLSKSLKEFYIKNPDKKPIGRKNSDESNIKNSITHKKMWENEEYRKKCVAALKKYWSTHQSPNLGTHLSEERKKKLSEHFKSKPNPKNKGENNGMYGKTPANIRKVIQLTLDDIFIKEWPSLKEAAKELGLSSPNILKVCVGERKKCGGFHWKYK